MILFLDIDGVLHPYGARQDQHFMYLPRLEAVLREHPRVRIVIASDWRKHHKLEELRGFFSEDIRFRIDGVIGIDAADRERGNRQRLVERYLAEHGLQSSPWIALDDEWDTYRSDAPIVRCDNEFGEMEERALRAALLGQAS